MKPILHPQTESRLQAVALAPTNAYVFHGAKGAGKFSASLWLAARLNCQADGLDDCRICHAVYSRNYPDLIIIEPESKSIGIADIQQLQQSLQLTQYSRQGHRVVVIDQAELLTTEAQNCLLKTLEEPAPGTSIILVATSIDRLLPTVQSRAQQVYFNPLPIKQLSEWLVGKHGQTGPEAAKLAQLAEGLPGLALELLQDPDVRQQYADSAELARAVLQSNRFDRLVAANRLAGDSQLAERFIQALIQLARQTIRTEQTDQKRRAADWLIALERYARYREGNVTLKVAIEGLMLEL